MRRAMFFVQLMGGLGNQMFQYALGRNLSIRQQTPLVLDASHLKDPGVTPREYGLDVFCIQATRMCMRDRLRFMRSRCFQKLGLPFFFLRTVKEQTCMFDASILTLEQTSSLRGYWQSYKYFSDIADQIRNDFQLKKTYQDILEQKKIYKKIRDAEQSISLHVRRTDYLSPVSQQILGTCSRSYYDEALRLMGQKEKDLSLFIFSDDLAWCKKTFHDVILPITFVGEEESLEDFEELILMSLCKHHIIANSTFSWWGAWLSSQNGIVIAPQKWFSSNDYSSMDLIPSNWLRVNV